MMPCTLDYIYTLLAGLVIGLLIGVLVGLHWNDPDDDNGDIAGEDDNDA